MSNSKKETDILLNKWLRYSKNNKSLHQPKRKMRQTLLIFIHSKAMFQIIC